MKFDIKLVCSNEEAMEFFKDKGIDLIATCMIMKQPTDDISKDEKMETILLAMDTIAEKHNFGPFQNLCDTCTKEFRTCLPTDDDIMFGKRVTEDNVCYCKMYVKKK